MDTPTRMGANPTGAYGAPKGVAPPAAYRPDNLPAFRSRPASGLGHEALASRRRITAPAPPKTTMMPSTIARKITKLTGPRNTQPPSYLNSDDPPLAQ